MNKPDTAVVNDNTLLRVYDLKKDYDSPTGLLPILKNVHFSVKPAEMAFIVGRSGSGKSTLLHILGGLDQATSGRVVFEGEDLMSVSENTLSRIRNKRMGFVFQQFHLLPELTLYENVHLPALIAGKPNDKWVKEILKRVKLLSRQDHYPSELSGGEQQRAAIARALINRPSIVFCDEPTGNLDRETSEMLWSLLNDLNRHDGQAFVIVTHDEALAWRYNNVYRLVDGVLLREDASRGLNIEQGT
jgi:lipoprotein-releasing system ATP-binding protein